MLPLAGGPLLRVATIRRTTDTFLFISHTKNVVFNGVRIIKEMPGSVASGTHCIIKGKIVSCDGVYPNICLALDPLWTVSIYG